jgi:hypothetical protein
MKRDARNILTAGLTTLALLATTGCQTFQPRNYEPNQCDQKGVYVDNNARDHSARENSLQGRDTLVYPTILNINF